MSGFRIDVDLSGLGMDQLADGAEAAVRPSAQAGAQVFYDQVKLNVRGIGRKTGNLDSSIYQVYSRDNSNKARAEYHISWNRKKAPHGHLVEFGHVQRYVTYIDKRGQWQTAVRPSMRGLPKPKRNAPQAVKDAYYVPLKSGPRIVGAKSFVRAAITPARQRQARNAMVDRFWWELEQRGLM
ncbi:MAG: hypothetical protein RJA36_1605 [Pseudomonadota bacterium]|jgi:hypothetical protein